MTNQPPTSTGDELLSVPQIIRCTDGSTSTAQVLMTRDEADRLPASFTPPTPRRRRASR